MAVAVFVASMLMIGGCARKAANPPKPAAQKSAVPLPEWAPKNPSPEFMRAAKVLKPMPHELAQNNYPTLPSVWEFFGSLSDDQIREFQRLKEVRMSRSGESEIV